jgi:hypothetical protein
MKHYPKFGSDGASIWGLPSESRTYRILRRGVRLVREVVFSPPSAALPFPGLLARELLLMPGLGGQADALPSRGLTFVE